MKNFVYLIAFVFLAISCHPNDTNATQDQPDATTYDSVLAAKLEADQYGMDVYVMAFLKRGPNAPRDSAHSAELQKAHMENIRRMAEAGKLVLAGPFIDGGELRGIYVFDVSTVEEAEMLTQTDPAIQYGSLIMELKPWYGSASLKQVNDLHTRIAKINP